MGQCSETIEINGITYRRQGEHETGERNRYVVVADRGWIFAGDLTEKDGRIHLERAVNLRSYSSVGIEGAIADPGSSNVTIKILTAPVDMPAAAELFRIPVGDEWGL